jgi:hypothetical protein
LAHRLLPPLTICGTPPSHRCFSLRGDCDKKKKQTVSADDLKSNIQVSVLAGRKELLRQAAGAKTQASFFLENASWRRTDDSSNDCLNS